MGLFDNNRKKLKKLGTRKEVVSRKGDYFTITTYLYKKGSTSGIIEDHREPFDKGLMKRVFFKTIEDCINRIPSKEKNY